MTKEELLEKFGHVELEFIHYRKFQFSFGKQFTHEGKNYDLLVITGGNCDSIYRTAVDVIHGYTLENLFRDEVIYFARLIEQGEEDEFHILYTQ